MAYAYCVTEPKADVSAIPVTVILASASTVAVPREEVKAMPVGVALASASMEGVPREEVKAMPVRDTETEVAPHLSSPQPSRPHPTATNLLLQAWL